VVVHEQIDPVVELGEGDLDGVAVITSRLVLSVR
jgi:hypothetical protein